MTPKNRIIEGKNWITGGRVKNDPKKSDIIYVRSLSISCIYKLYNLLFSAEKNVLAVGLSP